MPYRRQMRMRRRSSSRAGSSSEVACLGESAADDDALGVEHQHDVRDRDAEPAAASASAASATASPACAASTTASAVSRPPARATAGAATYASTQPGLPQPQTAASGRAVDRRVPELAGAAVPELEPPADDDRAADAGAEREERGRVAVAGGAEARLGEPERARVVDQRGRHAERLPQRVAHRHTIPRLRAEVRHEAGDAGLQVEDAGDRDARRVDAADLRRERPADLAELRDDPAGRLVRARLDDALAHLAVGVAVVLEHDALDRRAAEVEAEVATGHRGRPAAVDREHRARHEVGASRGRGPRPATSSGVPKSPVSGCSSRQRARGCARRPARARSSASRSGRARRRCSGCRSRA